jgi:hypothetical protein
MSYCNDCSTTYTGTLTDHLSTCEARTCDLCETQCSKVIKQDSNGQRVCIACRLHSTSDRYEESDLRYESDEDMETEDD